MTKQTIVCLDKDHDDEAILEAFRLLREHQATQTDVAGFSWAWTITGDLPPRTMKALKGIDALFDTYYA